MLNSCKKDVDSEFSATYIFQNNTETDIELILMGQIVEKNQVLESSTKKYLIAPKMNIVFEEMFPTTNKITSMPEDMLKSNNFLGDSLQINFVLGNNITNTIKYIKNETNRDSIYLESNYFYSQKDDYSVEYVWNFNE